MRLFEFMSVSQKITDHLNCQWYLRVLWLKIKTWQTLFLFSTKMRVHVFKGRKMSKHAEIPLLSWNVFASQRLAFSLRPNLEVKEGQI